MHNSLHNVGTPDIIDEFGALKEIEKEASERLKLLREEIIRRGIVAAAGNEYTVTVAESHRTSLDTDKIRKSMGDVWTAEHSRTTPVTQVTARKHVKQAA